MERAVRLRNLCSGFDREVALMSALIESSDRVNVFSSG